MVGDSVGAGVGDMVGESVGDRVGSGVQMWVLQACVSSRSD